MQKSEQKGDYAGTWQGSLKVGNGMELPLVFHFKFEGGKYTGTLDSPAQGALGMQFDAVAVDASGKIQAGIAKLHASFDGVLQPGQKSITGNWVQMGAALPISLSQVESYVGPRRPQEPKPPFPYKCEDVQFKDGDAVLSGTLTVPAGGAAGVGAASDPGSALGAGSVSTADERASARTYPAVVLIHGSGPHDRDETIFSHKPFLLLADYLTRRGIVVLRYDKRGCGKSTGNIKAATTKDFSDDALAAVEFLKTRAEVDESRIGLIGHSEGGVIAPCVAGQSSDVHFIVLMAASALPGDQILLSQVRALSRDSSKAELAKNLEIASSTYAILKAEPDNAKAVEQIKAMRKRLGAPEYTSSGQLQQAAQQELNAGLPAMTSAWYRYFISFDPREALAKVKCPVLALNGELDSQVPASQNLAAIKSSLEAGGNKNLTVVTLPGLNHLFQHCKSGLPGEYASIEETISPSVLKQIGDWILSGDAGAK